MTAEEAFARTKVAALSLLTGYGIAAARKLTFEDVRDNVSLREVANR